MQWQWGKKTKNKLIDALKIYLHKLKNLEEANQANSEK